MSELVRGGLVVGPGSSTDNAIARYDGTSGRLLQDSGALINDTGQLGINGSPSERLHLVGSGSDNVRIKFEDPGSHSFSIGTDNNSNKFFVMDGDSTKILYVDGTDNRVGVMTDTPGEALTVAGNLSIRNFGDVTKEYRFRTNGGALDLEGGGAGLVISNFANPGFTGTQQNYLWLEHDSHKVQAHGDWNFRTSNMGYDGDRILTVYGGTAAGVVINEEGGNYDLRVEGDTDTNLLFTDASTDRVGVGTNSPGSKLDVAGSLQCDSITNDTGLAAGTYTPTRSAEANLDANVTMTQAQYMRVGNTVTVSGRFTADPTLTATATSFEITLPVSSNLGAAEDAAGTAFCGAIAGQGAEIIGVAANDTAKIQWVSTDITSQSWSYTFTYRVI